MKDLESLAHLNDEQLIKSYNTAKGIFIGFIVVFILLIAAGIFITLKKGFGVFSVLPIVFITILIANMTNFNKLKAEMKSRNLLH